MIESEIRSGDPEQMAAADFRISHIRYEPGATDSIERRDGLVLDLAEAWVLHGRELSGVRALTYLSRHGAEQGQTVDGMRRILQHVDAADLEDMVSQFHNVDGLADALEAAQRS